MGWDIPVTPPQEDWVEDFMPPTPPLEETPPPGGWSDTVDVPEVQPPTTPIPEPVGIPMGPPVKDVPEMHSVEGPGINLSNAVDDLGVPIWGGREMFDPTGFQKRIGALESREMFDPTGLQERLGSLESREMFDPTGLQEQITALQEAPSEVDKLKELVAQLQGQQTEQQAAQQQAAQQQAAQEAELSKQYMVYGDRTGYNPYLSGQYQSDPYGPSGVPDMGGITTIPVPGGYGIHNPVYERLRRKI